MKRIAMLVIAFFLLLIINGCSSKLIFVPNQCVIPTIDDPSINTITTGNLLDESKRCASNYAKQKEAYEKLKKSIEICK